MKKVDYKWVMLALVSAAYFLAQGSRQIYAAVLPDIKAALWSGCGLFPQEMDPGNRKSFILNRYLIVRIRLRDRPPAYSLRYHERSGTVAHASVQLFPYWAVPR